MKFRSLFFIAAAAAVASTPISAQVVKNVNATYASGGVFSGQVTFLNDFSNVTAVSGFLTGGTYGNTFINWIWTLDGTNFASAFGPQYGGNFLMDGVTCGDYCGTFQNFITFTWDFSQGPDLTFATPGNVLDPNGGNNVAYQDPLVSGTISNVVPEPNSILLLSAGLGAVLAMARRRRA